MADQHPLSTPEIVRPETQLNEDTAATPHLQIRIGNHTDDDAAESSEEQLGAAQLTQSRQVQQRSTDTADGAPGTFSFDEATLRSL